MVGLVDENQSILDAMEVRGRTANGDECLQLTES